MSRGEDRPESRGQKGRVDPRVSLLAKFRRRTAPAGDRTKGQDAPHVSATENDPGAPQAPDPRHDTGQAPAELPRRDAEHAVPARRPVPRPQRPDDQLLERVARALRRL